MIYPGEETAGVEPQMDKKKVHEKQIIEMLAGEWYQRSIYRIFPVEEDQ